MNATWADMRRASTGNETTVLDYSEGTWTARIKRRNTWRFELWDSGEGRFVEKRGGHVLGAECRRLGILGWISICGEREKFNITKC